MLSVGNIPFFESKCEFLNCREVRTVNKKLAECKGDKDCRFKLHTFLLLTMGQIPGCHGHDKGLYYTIFVT